MDYTTTISTNEYRILITENTKLKLLKKRLDSLIEKEIQDTINHGYLERLSFEELNNVFNDTPKEIKIKCFYGFKLETFIEKFGFVFEREEDIQLALFKGLNAYIFELKEKARTSHVEGTDAA